MNNAIKKTLVTIEHHCLDLAYAPIRLQQRGLVNKLMHSIERHGQLMPVVIVEKAPQKWILIDGYLRLNALKCLREDTINAEIWDCDVSQALLAFLTEHQSRTWEALEEALLLKELKIHHGFSHRAIAEYLGCDKSWVGRRLSLIEHLPDFILQPILNGTVSLWAAQRILVPVARATITHAEKILDYLLENHTSTRDLQLFYEHYKKLHFQKRSKMVNELALFFKAQNFLRIEKIAKHLKNGPEGRWQFKLSSMGVELKQLVELAPTVLYQNQSLDERNRLLNMYHQIKIQFDLFVKQVEGVIGVN